MPRPPARPSTIRSTRLSSGRSLPYPGIWPPVAAGAAGTAAAPLGASVTACAQDVALIVAQLDLLPGPRGEDERDQVVRRVDAAAVDHRDDAAQRQAGAIGRRAGPDGRDERLRRSERPYAARASSVSGTTVIPSEAPLPAGPRVAASRELPAGRRPGPPRREFPPASPRAAAPPRSSGLERIGPNEGAGGGGVTAAGGASGSSGVVAGGVNAGGEAAGAGGASPTSVAGTATGRAPSVTFSVCAAPARRTAIFSFWPATALASAASIASTLRIGLSLIEVMRSSALSPDASAGPPGLTEMHFDAVVALVVLVGHHAQIARRRLRGSSCRGSFGAVQPFFEIVDQLLPVRPSPGRARPLSPNQFCVA